MANRRGRQTKKGKPKLTYEDSLKLELWVAGGNSHRLLTSALEEVTGKELTRQAEETTNRAPSRNREGERITDNTT